MQVGFHILALVALAGTLIDMAPAADGQIVITQAKALGGNVTPGDQPGFPITIARPGSYVFGSNIQLTTNATGIEVTADNVAIDLNGFRLYGGGRNGAGINAPTVDNFTVRNGTISAFGYDGVFGRGSHWVVEDMRIVANGQVGLITGAYARIRNSIVASNRSGGLYCEDSCQIDNVIASANGTGTGIFISNGAILNSTVAGNGSHGIAGIAGVAFGQSHVFGNNNNGEQVQHVVAPLFPNVCYPNC